MVTDAFKESLQQFQDKLEKGGASGQWAFAADGNTYALLFPSDEVVDDGVNGTGFAHAVTDYYVRNGAAGKGKKFMVRALLLQKDGKYEVDENTGAVNITALALVKTAMTGVVKNMVEFDAELSTFEDGKVTRGTTFVINKSGSGNRTTYIVNVLPEKQEANYPLPDVVADPIADNEHGINDIAAQFNEWSAKKVNGGTTDDGVDM